MNINKTGRVSWTESGIWLSMVLLVWLVVTSGLAIWYRSAARGRQVAYLTLASFGFLVLALCATLLSQHGEGDKPSGIVSANIETQSPYNLGTDLIAHSFSSYRLVLEDTQR